MSLAGGSLAGVVTCTLTEPGWWCITAHAEEGMKDRDGKSYPLRRRTSLWVFVDPKIGAAAVK